MPQNTIADFIAAFKKWGPECIVYELDNYNEPKTKGKKKKDAAASITWLPLKFKNVAGDEVYPKFKFSDVIAGGGAKFHDAGEDDADRKVSNMTMVFCSMSPEEIKGEGFMPKQIALTGSQIKRVTGMAKKVHSTTKRGKPTTKLLAKIKKELKEMFAYKRNYKRIYEHLSDPELDVAEFGSWLEGHVSEMETVQTQENSSMEELIQEYSRNTNLFVEFWECVHLAFVAQAKVLRDSQDEAEFTIAKGKGKPDPCEFKQSVRTEGKGKHKKEIPLPKPLYRAKIPVHSKTGRVGDWNYKEESIRPVYDARKSTRKNKFKLVEAKVPDEKGRMVSLKYTNAAQFLTFKSVLSGFVTLKDIAFHMFGISLGTKLTNLCVFSNQSKSKNSGYVEEELQEKVRKRGVSDDDESSDEEQDLPDSDASDASDASEVGDDPFDEAASELKESDAESDEELEEKPVKKQAKRKSKRKAAKKKKATSDDDLVDSDSEPAPEL